MVVTAQPDQIVIVGHGNAALAAAIAAAETAQVRGREVRVTLLERTAAAECGGNSRWSPSYIRMAAIDTLAPDFVADVLASGGDRADRAYVERLAADAPQTLAWIASHGVQFHRPPYYLAEGPPRIQPVGGGAALIRTLTLVARAAGVEIRYETRAERLIRGAEGAIRAVVAHDASGRAERIDASAVILACGGFSGNGAMLREHFGPGGESLYPISPGTRFNTGEGIRMAMAVGARTSGDWHGMHAEPIDARCKESAPVVLVYPYGIVVDQTGRRFFDEGAGLVHETWEHFARDIHFNTPNRTAYAILDSRLFDIAGYQRAIRSTIAPYQAPTLEALAHVTGIEAGGLQATMTAYNAAATGDPARFDATRIDGLAAAPMLHPPKSNWARAIDRPPYLAYPLRGAIAYTFGGLATNTDGQVLDAATSEPIPGLFAAGEITGHFYGTAPNAIAVLRALVFGRVAGRMSVNASGA